MKKGVLIFLLGATSTPVLASLSFEVILNIFDIKVLGFKKVIVCVVFCRGFLVIAE